MSDSNQDGSPKANDAPGSRDSGGTTVPSDDASVNVEAQTATPASQHPLQGPPESSAGQPNQPPSMAPDPVAQAHQAIYNTGVCALPPALLAEQIRYNFPGTTRPMSTPGPVAPASATATPYSTPYPTLQFTPPSTIANPQEQATTPPAKKAWRKTPVSGLSAPEKEARQKLVTASEHDRQIFLNFSKEPDHGGLAPDRFVALQRVFKHHCLSSYPASVAGIEAHKKARREGLAEIAHLKMQRERDAGNLSGGHAGESVALEDEEEGEGSESEDTGTMETTESQERVSDGITMSYSLNGRECTKEELDAASTSRYPRPQAQEVAAPIPMEESLREHQPTVPQQNASLTQDHPPGVPQQMQDHQPTVPQQMQDHQAAIPQQIRNQQPTIPQQIQVHYPAIFQQMQNRQATVPQ
ncbi:MAG: hypothetical protein Q9195_006664 [Heterodermia aff. obscurata]